MCKFISDTHVMPGYICCRCRKYNGLQRGHCKRCQADHHHFEIPSTVTQCPSCGFGWEGEMPTGNLAGESFNKDRCPCCKEPLKGKGAS